MDENAAQRPAGAVPTGLERQGDAAIEIGWSDGTSSHWTAAELRKACPCASCRQERCPEESETNAPPSLPVLSAAEAKPLQIESMRPVGSYAYGIAFSDGHSSGIYTFDLLYRPN